ncbi:MAG TPA: hypothetical protein VF753_12835 [Terriglobales bacterium]
MTIGIGVLASSRPKPHQPRPDSIVLIADTMGSTETDSTDALFKMWLDDELKVYAVGAGSLEYGGELFATIQQQLRLADSETITEGGHHRTHGRFSAVLNKSFSLVRQQHFQWDIVHSKLAMPMFGPQSGDVEMLRSEWQKFYLNIHMLVATFDHSGMAHLYQIGQLWDANGMIPKQVHLCLFPGFQVIGTGGENAGFWLNYRHQYLGRSVEQSLYHAYEAKQMADKAPTVNKNIEIAIIVAQQKAFRLALDSPRVEGCPFSLGELDAMFKEYGPQNTDDLGHPKQSVGRKSKGRR